MANNEGREARIEWPEIERLFQRFGKVTKHLNDRYLSRAEHSGIERGIQVSHLSEFETGTRVLTLPHLNRIAEALGRRIVIKLRRATPSENPDT